MIRKTLIIFYLVILTLLLVVGCATLPEDFEKPESYAYTDTDGTRLGKARRDEIKAHPGQSGFLLLGNGLDAFLARALLAENVERSIDAQYYLYHDDLIGRNYTSSLCSIEIRPTSNPWRSRIWPKRFAGIRSAITGARQMSSMTNRKKSSMISTRPSTIWRRNSGLILKVSHRN